MRIGLQPSKLLSRSGRSLKIPTKVFDDLSAVASITDFVVGPVAAPFYGDEALSTERYQVRCIESKGRDDRETSVRSRFDAWRQHLWEHSILQSLAPAHGRRRTS
jgi:hypothetical protein